MAAKKGAGFQRPWLHSGRIRGGVTQLPGDATAVIGCWSWVKRVFIFPILYTRFPILSPSGLGESISTTFMERFTVFGAFIHKYSLHLLVFEAIPNHAHGCLRINAAIA